MWPLNSTINAHLRGMAIYSVAAVKLLPEPVNAPRMPLKGTFLIGRKSRLQNHAPCWQFWFVNEQKLRLGKKKKKTGRDHINIGMASLYIKFLFVCL